MMNLFELIEEEMPNSYMEPKSSLYGVKPAKIKSQSKPAANQPEYVNTAAEFGSSSPAFHFGIRHKELTMKTRTDFNYSPQLIKKEGEISIHPRLCHELSRQPSPPPGSYDIQAVHSYLSPKKSVKLSDYEEMRHVASGPDFLQYRPRAAGRAPSMRSERRIQLCGSETAAFPAPWQYNSCEKQRIAGGKLPENLVQLDRRREQARLASLAGQMQSGDYIKYGVINM